MRPAAAAGGGGRHQEPCDPRGALWCTQYACVLHDGLFLGRVAEGRRPSAGPLPRKQLGEVADGHQCGRRGRGPRRCRAAEGWEGGKRRRRNGRPALRRTSGSPGAPVPRAHICTAPGTRLTSLQCQDGHRETRPDDARLRPPPQSRTEEDAGRGHGGAASAHAHAGGPRRAPRVGARPRSPVLVMPVSCRGASQLCGGEHLPSRLVLRTPGPRPRAASGPPGGCAPLCSMPLC